MKLRPRVPPVKQNSYFVFKLILAISISLGLSMVWLIEFNETENNVTYASFKLISKDFNNAVNLAHVEWLRMARPTSIKIYADLENLADFTKIKMNNRGWPDISPNNSAGCAKLWQNLLKQPLEIIHQNITIRYNNHTCIYQLNQSQVLTYQMKQGQVTYHNQGVTYESNKH